MGGCERTGHRWGGPSPATRRFDHSNQPPRAGCGLHEKVSINEQAELGARDFVCVTASSSEITMDYSFGRSNRPPRAGCGLHENVCMNEHAELGARNFVCVTASSSEIIRDNSFV